MKAILLAAGLGTRLLPLTRVLPKCLMPVHGRPLLEYWFRALSAAGVEQFLVNTHHLPDMVRGYIQASPWAGRVRLVFEPELLGTAGTLLANAAFAAGEPVMLVHADNLCGADLGSFIGAHARRAAGVCMTMMSFYADTPQNCGILELDAAGLVRGFYEKVANPPHHNANAAVYIVDPDVIDFAAGLSRTTLDFSTEVIPRFLGRIQVWHNRVYHRDIGTLASLFAAQEEYPAAAPALDLRPDPWHELCLANNWELADRLASALAAALALPEVRGLAPALPGPALHHLRESGELDRLRPGAPEAPGPGSALLLDKAAPDGAVRCQEIIGRAWRYLVLCATHAQRSDGKAC